jgi:hypothetical protein
VIESVAERGRIAQADNFLGIPRTPFWIRDWDLMLPKPAVVAQVFFLEVGALCGLFFLYVGRQLFESQVHFLRVNVEVFLPPFGEVVEAIF